MESDDVKIEPGKTEILDEIQPDEPIKQEADENDAVKSETEQVYFPECEESVVEEEICENDEFGEHDEDGEEEIKLENPEEKPKLEPENLEEKNSDGEQTNKQTILAERGTISQVEDMEIEVGLITNGLKTFGKSGFDVHWSMFIGTSVWLDKMV